ncbi:MAG: hypothetical protein KJ880_02075 [Candidatus Omnitrophica bacterium]|nr:hypothetical protein [Candidatus Omnitrophota bacterium]MBU1870015.1 hypothetical protein [Candidatus Omnitrophota bacterium]
MQIKKIGVLQSAKVMSLIYFVVSALFFFPMAIYTIASGGKTKEGFPGWGLFFFPFVYLVLGFVILSLFFVLYNLLAKFIGGIEIEIE